MRHAKPWYRSSKDAWYVEIDGKQVRLAKGKDNKKEAEREFHCLMAERLGRASTPAPSRLLVASLCDLFLEQSKRHNSPGTYDWYRIFLQDFCERCGGLTLADLIPLHVNRWLDAHESWGDTTRRCAITSVKRVFNWAVDQGLIPTSPVKSVKKPMAKARDRILTPEERQEILTAIKDQHFRDFVFALQETGCRPSEVARVTAADVILDAGTWTLERHKTARKTGKPRVVYLTAAMLLLSRKLMARFPEGPLFRGPRRDRPFTPNGIRCRFRRLRERLPHLAGVVAYTYRHSFATDALEHGVAEATVSELLGHEDTSMLHKYYSKLSKKTQALRAAVEHARSA